MAVKKERKGVIQAPAPEAAPGGDDLPVMHPNLTATIGDREVTVREYGFIEGLGLRPLAQPFLDDLHAQIKGKRIPVLEEILVLLGKHHLLIQTLVATAADVEEAWVAKLNQDDGYGLLMMWWRANGPFFIRSVFNRLAAEHAEEKVRAGQTSTQPSSEPDTETRPQSA